ncbi:hypothetical protein GFD17_03460 [Bifidobacterium sp. SMB2]|uniref:Membrane associated protein n=2 Tax=Bifidobacterium TaxID=1678 RepID=A0ABX0CAF0_9BIFI|nr:hypothetical protein [Bifidobacterium sp. SMB2]NEH12104.1 hypothetical protein [Bifidobacterium saimiriisciurei]
MTGNKNSNADASSSNTGPNDGSDMDRQWEDFLASHEGDLNDVARSRSARKFDKAARKAEKKARFDVNDLKDDAFATPPHGRGPRDFQGRSWLDTDDVMDDDSTFTPPNPDLGPVNRAAALFVGMTVVGVLCLVVSVLIPSVSALSGSVGGVLTLLGAGGLFMRHRGHSETRRDEFDDGARV